MLPVPTILMVSMASLSLLVVIVIISTGNFVAGLVVIALVGVLGYVLFKLGILDVNFNSTGLDVQFHERAPAPAPAPAIAVTPHSLEQKEVFFVSGNEYTYDDAPAVCAAYNADLASYDQINTAFLAGAEWCGYGWTQGGMALFPTQQSTWELLQQETDITKRTGCGRPGINGGYFNPSNKFGVNCFGVKPQNKNTKFPIPVPGTDEKNVDKYKSMLSRMTVAAFNRVGWSEWNMDTHVPTLKTSLTKSK